MKYKAIPIIIFITCFLLGACGAPSKFVLTGNKFPPYEGPVKILTSPPEAKYVEIGWVSSKGGPIHQWADLLEAMQTEAAQYGSNAIILVTKDSNSSSFVTYNPQFGLVGGSGSSKNLMAIAIRILE